MAWRLAAAAGFRPHQHLALVLCCRYVLVREGVVAWQVIYFRYMRLLVPHSGHAVIICIRVRFLGVTFSLDLFPVTFVFLGLLRSLFCT